MTCEPISTACSIDELGRTLTSFNANDLLATAIATVIGVIVGAMFALIGSRFEAGHARELREQEADTRRVERMDVALERIIWEINNHSIDLRKVWERQQADQPQPEWLPSDFSILAAIAAARMLAKTDDEKAVLDRIRELALNVRLAEVKARVASLTLVWRTLIQWREGAVLEVVLKDIDDLEKQALGGAPVA